MMNRMIMRGWAAAAVSLSLLAGCGAQPQKEAEEWDAARSHLLGLTQEQRLEDYDVLVETLKESYLCMGVRDRANPQDPSQEIFSEYRRMIEESDSDEAFYSAVYSTLFRLGTYGHLWIVEPEQYREYLEIYGQDTPPEREHWRQILADPVTRAGYERLETLLESYEEEEEGGASTSGDAPQVQTLLLPGGSVGYVKVDHFPSTYGPEQEQLFSFYDTLGDCSDLIIDITDNSGGSELFWQELLAAPFLDRPLSCTHYALLADSANNHPYVEDAFPDGTLRPISQLPELPALNREGLSAATHFVESTLTAAPGTYRAPFHGRIWVLVGEKVYSASESFAVFCKETGFAVLVGEQTGGDGIGALDPIFMRLPNSGLLVQFTMMFGLNADGSSNEETGTAPDIPSPAGEPALVTALRVIGERGV